MPAQPRAGAVPDKTLPSYEEHVTALSAVFLALYNSGIEIGADADRLNHGLLAAGIEAAAHNYGPGPAVAWLRRLADDLEAQYPPDASRH